MHRCLALLALVAGTSAGAAGLSAAERRIVAAVDANQAAAMTLIAEAVNIQSATENHAGVRKVGDVFARELAALGFDDELGRTCRRKSDAPVTSWRCTAATVESACC